MQSENIPELSEDQLSSLRADYLYEMATETGFGAPRLWNSNAPRNFKAYLAQKGFKPSKITPKTQPE